MNLKSTFLVTLPCVIAAALLVCPHGSVFGATKPKAAPAGKAVAQTNEVVTIASAPAKPVEIPQSVFVVSNNPRDGRNPFFPKSMAAQPAQTTVVDRTRKSDAPKKVDTSGVILNGLTGPPKRLAMINGRTFEVGESAEIKLPNGVRVLVKCEEIKDESVVVSVAGERRELKLRELASSTPAVPAVANKQ